MPAPQVYHSKDLNHLLNVQIPMLKAEWRLMSLSIYGKGPDPLFASIWVHRPDAPKQLISPAISGSYFDEHLKTVRSMGYVPRIIGATGSLQEPTYCLVAEEVRADDGTLVYPFMVFYDGVEAFFAPPPPSASDTPPGLRASLRVQWIASFGKMDNKNEKIAGMGFAMILKPAPMSGGDSWNATGPHAYDYLQKMKDALNIPEASWVRPSLIVPIRGTPDFGDRYVALWEDNIVEQISHEDLTSDDFDAVRSGAESIGYYPIRLMATGAPGEDRGVRFAAIFAKDGVDKPKDRTFYPVQAVRHVVSSPLGTLTLPEPAGYKLFDDFVRTIMMHYRIRAGQLAMTYKGRLVFAHAYTFGEASYPATTNTVRFRVNSISKIVTATAMMMYLDQGALGGLGALGTTKVAKYLKHSATPFVQSDRVSPPKDARIEDITLFQCLTHTAGWDGDLSNPWWIRADLNAADEHLWPLNEWNAKFPVTNAENMAYVSDLEKPLKTDPGKGWEYHGFGLFVAGRIIQQILNGFDDVRGVQRDLFINTLKLQRPKLAEMLLTDGISGEEVRYHPGVPDVQVTPENESGQLVSSTYAWLAPLVATHGGWTMAAVDMAKLLAAFDAVGKPNPIMSKDAVGLMWGHPPFASNTLPWSQLIGWFRSMLIRRPPPPGSKEAKPSVHPSTEKTSPPPLQTYTLYWHNGAAPGSCALAGRRNDGWSFALFFNKDIQPGPDPFGAFDPWGGLMQPGGAGQLLSDLADKFTQSDSWPSFDLFSAKELNTSPF